MVLATFSILVYALALRPSVSTAISISLFESPSSTQCSFICLLDILALHNMPLLKSVLLNISRPVHAFLDGFGHFLLRIPSIDPYIL